MLFFEQSSPVHANKKVVVALLLAAILIAVPRFRRRPEEDETPARSWHQEALVGLEVLPRSEWEAAPVSSSIDALGKPSRVTVHHGGVRYVALDRTRVAKTLRAIQRDHIERRHWSDIGYHFVVDPAGRLWQGRPVTLVGAHAGSSRLNHGNLGILLLGNFDVQEPSDAQLRALERLLTGLCRATGIPRSRVLGHDEVRKLGGMGGTECPGANLRSWLARWR